MSSYRFLQVLCCIALAFVLAKPAWAENPSENETTDYEVCEDPDADATAWLDRVHGSINESLCVPVVWFDRFFGDARSEELSPASTFFRWRTSVRWDKEEGGDVNTRLHANLKLPQASNRLRLLISREGELDELTDQDDAADLASSFRSSSTEVSLRYTALSQVKQNFTVAAGIHSGFPPDPFVRGRYHYARPLSDNTLLRLTETAYWEREDGFGLNSRLDWEWYYNPQTLLRWTGSVTVDEESQGLDWYTTVTAFHQLDTHRALRSEIGLIGHTKPDADNDNIEEYYVNLRYRTNFWRRWLFLELQPELAWPVDDQGERVFSPRFFTTLEVQFERR